MVYDSISTEITVSELIRLVWMRQNKFHDISLVNLFTDLIYVGCDYYELMELYSEHDLSESELCILAAQAPMPKIVLSVSKQNIRRSIFRWTASKYHTNNIVCVVEDIYNKLLLGKSGMTIYNSNRNPRNKSASNEKYVLIIVQQQSLFLDINRKKIVKFIND